MVEYYYADAKLDTNVMPFTIDNYKGRNRKFKDLKINDKFVLLAKSGEFIKCKKVSDTEAKFKGVLGFELSKVDQEYPIIKI